MLILYNPQAIEQEELFFFLMQWGYLSPSREGSGMADSPSVMERTAASVAVSIMEFAFTQLIGALI